MMSPEPPSNSAVAAGDGYELAYVNTGGRDIDEDEFEMDLADQIEMDWSRRPVRGYRRRVCCSRWSYIARVTFIGLAFLVMVAVVIAVLRIGQTDYEDDGGAGAGASGASGAADAAATLVNTTGAGAGGAAAENTTWPTLRRRRR